MIDLFDVDSLHVRIIRNIAKIYKFVWQNFNIFGFVGLRTGTKFQMLENKIINYEFGQKFLVDRSEHILPDFTLRLRLY